MRSASADGRITGIDAENPCAAASYRYNSTDMPRAVVDREVELRLRRSSVILEVTDDGTPRLTSYRRVIVRVTRDP